KQEHTRIQSNNIKLSQRKDYSRNQFFKEINKSIQGFKAIISSSVKERIIAEINFSKK
ncbi:unnamed protein product, partial [Musa textilis]